MVEEEDDGWRRRRSEGRTSVVSGSRVREKRAMGGGKQGLRRPVVGVAGGLRPWETETEQPRKSRSVLHKNVPRVAQPPRFPQIVTTLLIVLRLDTVPLSFL